ncbi:MAG: anaerobic ribonucleoside-triphosphate reductase activating protein [Selenomonadaceae bacterium]|nr:anaerobic ribonucleoside-triphosphate reductase activating protein [Selenomonadaceae bacterium]
MKLKVAGIVDDSVVDGEGYRLTVFVQGCPRRCKNCQNRSAQPFNGGQEMDTAEILERVAANPLLSGVTFSGGEPFCQPRPLTELARQVHRMGLNVWSYSGFTLDELWAKQDPDVDGLLTEIDVLVDGDYQEDKRDLSLPFRGSANQRIIDLRHSTADNLALKYAC